MARHLITKYRIVAADLPGFGMSSRSERASYAIPDQTARLYRIAASIGLDSFHLAGNSMGGSIAGRYAAEFPNKVKSLALLNTGGSPTARKRANCGRNWKRERTAFFWKGRRISIGCSPLSLCGRPGSPAL